MLVRTCQVCVRILPPELRRVLAVNYHHIRDSSRAPAIAANSGVAVHIREIALVAPS
jgi:hypothetical protein